MPNEAAVQDVYNIPTTMGQEQSNTTHAQAWNLNGNATAHARGINATSGALGGRANGSIANRGSTLETNSVDIGIAKLHGAVAKVCGHAKIIRISLRCRPCTV